MSFASNAPQKRPISFFSAKAEFGAQTVLGATLEGFGGRIESGKGGCEDDGKQTTTRARIRHESAP